MKRTFFVECPNTDMDVRLEIDVAIVTDEVATAVNKFWEGWEERLQAEGGDVMRTVAKMAAHRFMRLARASYYADAPFLSAPLYAAFNRVLSNEGGWPPSGIELVELFVGKQIASSVDLELTE